MEVVLTNTGLLVSGPPPQLSRLAENSPVKQLCIILMGCVCSVAIFVGFWQLVPLQVIFLFHHLISSAGMANFVSVSYSIFFF